MSTLGVQVAIAHKGEILLVKRRDFDVWALPGGHVEYGESLAQAAGREVLEETGLEIGLQQLVGIYSMPAWKGLHPHVAVFTAAIIGGEAAITTNETTDMAFFSPDALPDNMLWWHKQRIDDALAGAGGSLVWTQDAPWPFDDDRSRQDIYAARDQSNLSSYDYFKSVDHEGDETLDVGEINR